MTLTKPIFLLFAAAAIGRSQQPDTTIEFEAATIKESQFAADSHAQKRDVDEIGRVEYYNIPLAGLIFRAYHLQQGYQLTGPTWLYSQHYDVMAKPPQGAPTDQHARMLQSLLADRFRLKLHREQREMAAYILVIGKGGPKFREYVPSTIEPSAAEQSRSDWSQDDLPHLPPQGGTSWVAGMGGNMREHLTMAAMANKLTGFMKRPVMDETGLKGTYSIRLHWGQSSASQMGAPADSTLDLPTAAAGLPSALQSQLGLRLEPSKASVEVIVVDAADRSPKEN